MASHAAGVELNRWLWPRNNCWAAKIPQALPVDEGIGDGKCMGTRAKGVHADAGDEAYHIAKFFTEVTKMASKNLQHTPGLGADQPAQHGHPGPAGVYSVERVLKGTAGRRLPAAEIKNGGKHQPRQQPLLVRDEAPTPERILALCSN